MPGAHSEGGNHRAWVPVQADVLELHQPLAGHDMHRVPSQPSTPRAGLHLPDPHSSRELPLHSYPDVHPLQSPIL